MLSRRAFQQAISTSSRSYSAAAAAAATQPSLDLEFPGVPTLKPATSRPKPTTKVTTLPNGLRVASEETYQQASTIGLFVDAGSRQETDANNGVSHMLEHMAFKSTESRSHLRIVRDVEDFGGNVGASSAREYMMYTADVLRPYVGNAVELLAENLKKPKFLPWDIDEQRKVIGYELEELSKDAQAVVTELLHAAAYGDYSPLGRSMYCPERNLNKLSAEDLKSFMGAYFVPSRMVLSGAGVDHDELVKYATKYFGDITASSTKIANTPCTYIGGDMRLRGDSPVTHFLMCFNSANGWNSKEILPTCVAHMLLGGGSSFSSGGPGKGMYSRIYTRVLNKYHWVESCTAFNSFYNDNGLIGIYGTCKPSEAGTLANIMSDELLTLAKGPMPSDVEISRAKNQLKSSVIMNLESRAVLCEDIGRQLLTYGKREDAATICANIDKVTPAQVQQAIAAALKSPLTVAAFGDVSTIPSRDALSAKFR